MDKKMNKLDIKVGDLVKIKNFDNYFKVITIYADGSIGTVETNASDGVYYDIHCKEDIAEVKRPCQYKTIYKREEPILDDKEKEYLSAVIRPFKEKVSYIVKHAEISDYGGEEIYIYYKCMSGEFSNGIILPSFEAGTMYKGMELYKKYTLEELGL